MRHRPRRQPLRVCACLALCIAWPAMVQATDAEVSSCARSFASAAHGNEAAGGTILLLGDSTVAGSMPRRVDPEGPHLEIVMQAGLNALPGIPAFRVVNLGVGGGYIRQLLSSAHYDATVGKQQDVRFVLMRFGLNDHFRLADFASDFPADYGRLVQRLRADHPRATLVMMTVIPYHSPKVTAAINASIRRIAKAQGLPLLDTHAPYEEALRDAPHRLSYRSLPMEEVPLDDLPAVARHVYVVAGIPRVVVLDDALDRRLGRLPRWFADRHPNFEGYRVIGGLSSRFLADCIRASRDGQLQSPMPESRPRSP